MGRYIGGEFWYNDALICKEGQLDEKAWFLSGGQSSLQVICDYLKASKINKVVLPSYLCPDILDRFELNNIKYDFYNIAEDFSIDIEDLKMKSVDSPAVFFINYFGFLSSKEEYRILSEIKNEGKILIEDNVHCLFNRNIIGSFSFNSFRKFVPYDGSYLYSDYNLEPYIPKYEKGLSERIHLIREARELKTKFILNKEISENEYLEKFRIADQTYITNNLEVGNKDEKYKIDHIDWKLIAEIRRENYRYLVKMLLELRDIEVIFPELEQDTIPIGLPIYLKKGKRDELRDFLKRQDIFAPIHWNLQNDIRLSKNFVAIEMSKEILTLVIDQRYSKGDMDSIYKFISIYLNNN